MKRNYVKSFYRTLPDMGRVGFQASRNRRAGSRILAAWRSSRIAAAYRWSPRGPLGSRVIKRGFRKSYK